MKYKNINIDDIRKQIKEVQTKSRYTHTLGVAYTAASLAMKYETNIEQAFLAGILHDCAKCLSEKQLLTECNKNHININEYEQQSPYLLHAKLGAFYAINKYHIEEEDIINAITYHTTGRANMSILEKIIFVADYIEPNRDRAPKLNEIRKISFDNIDYAIYLIIKDTIEYIQQNKRIIDSTSFQTMHYYQNLINKENKEI